MEDTQVVELYTCGKSLRHIAELSGKSHEGIRKILVRNNVPLRGKTRRSAEIPEDTIQKIKELLNKDETVNTIVGIFNIPHYKIEDIAKDMGLDRSRGWKFRKEKAELESKLLPLVGKLTEDEIAKTLNISIRRVKNILEERCPNYTDRP